MCDCHNCRTGKCHCRQCKDGPGINFLNERSGATLMDEIMRDVRNERLKIKELRAPSPERQKVRRWGDIDTGRTENREEIRNALDEREERGESND